MRFDSGSSGPDFFICTLIKQTMMKKLLFMACAAAALAACSDDDAPAPFVVCPTGTRISLEASEMTDLYGEPAVCGKVDVYASGNLAY